MGKVIYVDLSARFMNSIVSSYLFPGRLRTALINLWGADIRGGVFPHVYIDSPRLSMGDGSFINSHCRIYNKKGNVTIGSDVAIGFGTTIITITHDYGMSSRRAGILSGKDVCIEDGCWIGANVTICPGSSVGEGTVVAAGAVVVGDLEANCLYAGVPARIVKHLE